MPEPVEGTTYTVQQLIEELSEFPGDMPVLTSGCKSGFENILQPYIQLVKHCPENPYTYGEFEATTSRDGFKAVILLRNLSRD